MHPCHRFVDGMLHDAVFAFQSLERAFEIVVQRLVIERSIALTVELLKCLQLFDKTQSDVRGQIEVESWNGLSAVHLVLRCFQRDTRQHTGRLDALGCPRRAMASRKTVIENVVQRMLTAGERLCGIIIFVVYMQIVMLHGLPAFLAKKIVVDKGFGRFAREFHHHSRGCIRVHVGIFARHIIVFHVDDFEKHISRFRLSGNAALIAVGNVCLRHVFPTAFHQLHLHEILYSLHRHLRFTGKSDAVCNLLNQFFVFALVCIEHCLADSGHYFLVVEAHDAAIAFYHRLYHFAKILDC